MPWRDADGTIGTGHLPAAAFHAWHGCGKKRNQLPFSCFKNHFYDFLDYQITCLQVIILSRANIFNILKQQLQKTYALFKHTFRS